ncbi:two-component sensor histidine kinase [Devosia yakushimensis]|uniref:histidine kinase n=1 Tax=Devosia yakushimensis TaxID=470028 RepID=A0ABQ5UJ58_9HYPH|nr:two-component sensor histidine kinase [Devosia yakushimensis]
MQQEIAWRGGHVDGARIIEDPTTKRRVAAYQLPNGRWATIDVPDIPPPPGAAWLVLVTWLTVTVIGVGSVALIMARRVTEPYSIIERAVASVDPSGELPHLKVEGSAEARQVKASLNSLSGRLKSALQARMRLVAAAGHDLRTPMTRMRLRAELLPDADQADWLSDIDELEKIAESAIGLVREESGTADHTSVDMAVLVRETVQELNAADLSVDLGTLEDAWVHAGPLSLRRALRNLITNAATYGGGATVSLQQQGETVFVRIEDNGPGIPEHMLTQVFEPFFRADFSRSNTKGAGLGLTIANEIVERLGGSLTIENRPTGGLLQIVALPSAW